MWTTENRGRYDRDRLRYPSVLTDEEWKLVEPLIPPAKRGGEPIGNIPPAEAEERYYAMTEQRAMAA